MKQNSSNVYRLVIFVLTFLLGFFLVNTVWGSSTYLMQTHSQAKLGSTISAAVCVAGQANGYPCSNVNLLAHMSAADLGANARVNDLWGWTDSFDGREYALVGLDNGTAFVDISLPESPIYLGNLPTHTTNSIWRDIKVYDDHAFIVSEANGHGMQVFDLTELRNVANPPVTFSETTHYDQIGRAHNLAINEESGFAYAVGTTSSPNGCSDGLHIINIQTPTAPTFAGCFDQDGYTHDAQCVIYQGVDAVYQNREICFNANVDTLTVVDVTNSASLQQVSRTGTPGFVYAHQGWLTEDHRYFLMDDEQDEIVRGHPTKTYIWDVSDLDDPVMIGTHSFGLSSSDHNLYVKGNYVYEANYSSGLRILDLTNIGSGVLVEVGYFDTFPTHNNAGYAGAWSNYPFYESGVVTISDYDTGFFIVRHQLPVIDELLFLPAIFSE